MSLDNGVYILETAGPEFRVAHSHAIDNIYGKFNDETLHWDGDMDRMMDVFGPSKVYNFIEDAVDYASKISYTYEYLEDGICVITDFKSLKFGQIY
jgi:hypothetical protein